ncbi:MAG TPA: hypothetical protein VFB33_03670 [Candidatus Binataceae bacterium]|nr:hypothetical protein [Candidatus Binataceae bacterium]
MKAAIVLAALLTLASLTAPIACAQPAFSGASASVMNGFDQGDLLIRWTETGLTAGQVITYNLAAEASAVYGCATKVALDQPLCAEVDANPSRTIWIVEPKNSTRHTTTLDEPEPDSACVTWCQSNQGSLVLYRVNYQNVSITDQTNDISFQLNGPFSYTFCKVGNLKSCPPPS